MKKITLLVLLALWGFMGVNAYSADKTIKVATGEWAPFMSQKLKHYGFITHIVTDAFAAEGVKVEYTFCPWARAMDYTKKGVTVASSAWYWNEERAKYFHFSDPVFVEQQVFFHLKERPFGWQKMDDLKGIRIGAMIGYFYGKNFKQAEDSGILKVDRIASDELNFKKLLAHRVNIVVVSLFVGQSLLRTKFSEAQLSKITYHPKPVLEGPLCLIFTKNAKGLEWLPIFNRGLGKLKASGKLDEFFNRALKGDYHPKK